MGQGQRRLRRECRLRAGCRGNAGRGEGAPAERRPRINDEGPPARRLADVFAGPRFKDPSRCRLLYDIAGVEELSEAGRLALVRRIRGRVGLDELLVIFEKARIHRMDSRVTAMVAAQTGLPPGPELDQRVQRLWAETINKRFLEILEARCPA